MPNLPSLGDLPVSSRRGLARNLMSGFYERGLNSGQALKELQELGLGYRRQDFLTDFRSGLEGYKARTAIRYVRGENVPSERILEAKYFKSPDHYSLVFKYEGTDTTTGETREGYFFYHRNSLETREKMEQDAADWFTSKHDQYGIDVGSIRVVEGYINPYFEKNV